MVVAIYALSLSALFGVSALYHVHNWERPSVRRWMRRLDHTMIFFLIAGTLAPPMEAEIRLIETVMAEQTELPHALFVTSEGELREGGRTVGAGVVTKITK